MSKLKQLRAVPVTAVAVGLLAVPFGIATASHDGATSHSVVADHRGSATGCRKVDPAKATSAAAFGGMACLIKAAQAEGHLNVITLPRNWANYGTIMNNFEKKYHISITDENPEGTSAEELTAIEDLKGQSRAPDVVDMGTAFAIDGTERHLFASYKVQTWKDIPAVAKSPAGYWFDDYGGYVSIGCDAAKVKVCPTTFADLLKPEYKNMVGLNGSPTEAGAAFDAVWAAALANGGSFRNIEPGITFFHKMHQVGNFVPVTADAATVESGQTPIVIWWDYLEESEIAQQVPHWKVVIPAKGTFASYYTQAISATAPNPAAARLWEEYLYSTVGQNLWLQGYTDPIELSAMLKDHTVNRAFYDKLPRAPKGRLDFPSAQETTTAGNVLDAKWASAVG